MWLRCHGRCSVILIVALAASAARADDLVEFLSGAKAHGTVKAIRKAEKEFDFEVQLGGRTLLRTYAFDRVHAVTLNGKRYVLNESAPTATAADEAGSTRPRTKSQVLELIDTLGRTPPDWFASTPLDYPPTLELDWPLQPADKGWNNQKNVGQYKWDIINPNPGRWRSGVRLMHEVMARHQDQPELLRRDVKALAEIYFELFQDYPRAAFWLRQAKVSPPDPQSTHLAECYWRLGNKAMALEMLKAPRMPMNAIKLLGDMGQTDRAAELAESFGRSYPDRAHEPYLLAGDACRLAGRYNQAIDFYQRVLDLEQARNEDYHKIYVGRAQDSIAAIQLFDKADVSKLADGKYRDSSTGYSGPVEVEVEVGGGKITAVRVTRHQERQFYAALTDTPNQIIKKQSVKQIDATSRATITSQAIVNATAKALAKGAR
jgi:uncharacterized protein with FMN-binding domain